MDETIPTEYPTIRYSITIDDHVNLSLIIAKMTPATRSMMHNSRLAISAAPILTLFFMWLFDSDVFLSRIWLFGPLAVLLSVAIWIWYPSSYWKSNRKKLEKMASESAGKGIVGEHTLTLRGSVLVENVGGTETKTNVDSLHKILITDKYAALMISAFHAHLIPLSGVDDGDVDEFVRLLLEVAGSVEVVKFAP